MSHDQDPSKKVLLGFIVGSVVGTAAILLLTHKPARKIFQDVSGQAQKCAKNYMHFNGASSGHANNRSEWLGEHKFLCSSVVGALLAAMGGVFLIPKASSQLRHYLTDTYQEVNDRTWELLHRLNQKGGEIVNIVGEQTFEWMEKTLTIADEVTNEVDAWAEIIKTAANRARAIAAHMEEDSRQQQHILEVVEWSQKAVDIANEVTHEAQNWTQSIRDLVNSAKLQKEPSNSPENMGNPVVDIIEWAALGVNLWQNMRHRNGDSR